MPKYEEINWSKGECSNIKTDLFFSGEEQRSADAYWLINAARSVCGKCVIQKECLSYAFKYEPYGVWGGLTSNERKSFSCPEKYYSYRQRALLELSNYGITLDFVKECYEYSSDV